MSECGKEGCERGGRGRERGRGIERERERESMIRNQLKAPRKMKANK